MVACNEKMVGGRTGGVAGGRSHTPFSGVACNARSAVDRPSLGTWTSQDPAQYINGANTYQFVESGPVGRVDASGLAVTAIPEFRELAKPIYKCGRPQAFLGDYVDCQGKLRPIGSLEAVYIATQEIRYRSEKGTSNGLTALLGGMTFLFGGSATTLAGLSFYADGTIAGIPEGTALQVGAVVLTGASTLTGMVLWLAHSWAHPTISYTPWEPVWRFEGLRMVH